MESKGTQTRTDILREEILRLKSNFAHDADPLDAIEAIESGVLDRSEYFKLKKELDMPRTPCMFMQRFTITEPGEWGVRVMGQQQLYKIDIVRIR